MYVKKLKFSYRLLPKNHTKNYWSVADTLGGTGYIGYTE